MVKPDIAATQLTADRAAVAAPSSVEVGTGATVGPNGATASTLTAPGVATFAQQATIESTQQLRRFHGSVTINPIRLGRDASRIAEEVVQHLASIVGSNVEITLEIHCELPDGASEKLVRDVTENCRTLGFTNYGFEEE